MHLLLLSAPEFLADKDYQLWSVFQLGLNVETFQLALESRHICWLDVNRKLPFQPWSAVLLGRESTAGVNMNVLPLLEKNQFREHALMIYNQNCSCVYKGHNIINHLNWGGSIGASIYAWAQLRGLLSNLTPSSGKTLSECQGAGISPFIKWLYWDLRQVIEVQE